MGFLDQYVEKYQLPALDEKTKQRLQELKDVLAKLDYLSPTEEKFSDLIQQYSGTIFDLVDRIKANFADWKFSFGDIVSRWRFVVDIASEVTKIVNELSDKIVPANSTPEEAHKAKLVFGQELTYFIYLLWNPRLIKWVPESVETWLEKYAVYWISGVVVDWALNYFEKDETTNVVKLKSFGQTYCLQRTK